MEKVPPTAEQAARGWSQDWTQHWREHEAQLTSLTSSFDKFKVVPDEKLPEGGVLHRFDFTGGPLVRAAREQAAKETAAWEQRAITDANNSALSPLPAGKLVAVKAATLLTAPLVTGAFIPLLGLGTWKSKPGEVRAAVLYAVTQCGYRHIDCASVYENEGEVGEALAEIFAKWDVSRAELFITGKLWNADHAAARVEPAIQKSLKLLRLSYFDAFLCHWPISGNRGATLEPPMRETWQAMEAAASKGLVRVLGVSNFSIRKMEEIQSYAKVPLAISQNEAHPFFRNDAIVDFCNKHNIHFTAFSPLGSPDSADIFKRGKAPVLLDLPMLHDIAARVGKNTGQVLIRWGLAQRPTASILPKSVSEGRIKGNAAIDWDLAPDDLAALSGLKEQYRMVHGGVFLSPAGPYRTLADLWDE